MTSHFVSSSIRQYRLSKGLSQKSLARIVGVSSNQISNIERGVHDPSVFLLCKICYALDVSLSDFFDGYIFLC